MSNSVNASHSLNKKRVAWWNITPTLKGGNRLYDTVSSYSYYGNLFNPEWKDDPSPGGKGYINFTGTNSYGSVANYPAIQITGSLTIAAWVKSSTVNSGIVLSKGTNVSAATSSYWLRFISGGARASFGVSDGTWQYEVNNSSDVNDGQWHRWVGVFNSSSATIAIYMDGQLAGSGLAPTSVNNLNQPLYMASNGTTFTPCSMDDISIWSRALSSSDIKTDYNESKTGSSEMFVLPIKKRLSNIRLFYAGLASSPNSNMQMGML